MNPPIALSEAQIEARRKGGRVIHSPEMLAKRLSRAWPELDDRTREAVAAALGPLVLLRGKTAVDLVVEHVQELSDDDDRRLVEALFPGGGRDGR
jgi:hypothetical protein